MIREMRTAQRGDFAKGMIGPQGIEEGAPYPTKALGHAGETLIAGGGRSPSGQSSLNHMSWTSSGRSA